MTELYSGLRLANGPKLVGLCGFPKAGKTTAQKILQTQFGLQPMDDGAILRDMGMMLFGLTRPQVTTQEGKNEVVEIDGEPWQVRKILGELGNILEAKFGQQTIPLWAIRSAIEHWSHNYDTTFHSGYSFGSVRKAQGRSYRKAGGIVIEIVRSDTPWSGNDFDLYDSQYITATVHNPAPNSVGEDHPDAGMYREQFAQNLRKVMREVL